MKYQNALNWLIPPIFILTLVAALAGLWPTEGAPYPLTTFRGEDVAINARGLYYWDTVSSAAQMQANDLIALTLGCPYWRFPPGWPGAKTGSIAGYGPCWWCWKLPSNITSRSCW
jgi:hypothetical protein